MSNQLFFVSGLPRSGSTLLMNILGQHPKHHVTPTNDLIELFVGVRNTWKNMEGFRAQGEEAIEPRIVNTMAAILDGFFKPEFEAGKVVFDKSRGWPAYIELLEKVLGRPVKIICTTRSVPDIVASMEKKRRASVMGNPDPVGTSAFPDMQTITGRAQQLLSPGAMLGMAVNRVRDAQSRGLGDRLVKVAYSDLANNPAATMEKLHQMLGLEPFKYDFENVQQLTHEDDWQRGMTLHKIRPKVEPEKKPGWVDVLPAGLAKHLISEYSDFE